jgi:serine/threonine protein kinase
VDAQSEPIDRSDHGADERAFLQARVALFWKVIFSLVLISGGLGAFGAIARPGMDWLLTLASSAQAGIFWWLCRRGQRSIRFSRATDSGGSCTQGGEFDVVKLLDFGLVKEFEVDRAVTLTGLSAVVGTPQYMPPECILRPASVDARADIYALGAVAYYLLAGVVVFDGKSVIEVCSQHLHQEPAPLSTRGVAVPAALEAVVLACLHKDPARRPQSAAELRLRIEACNIAAWDSERARLWWLEHQPELDRGGVQDLGEPRTLAVDRAHRGP